jgi:hypothetical protein
MGLPKVLSRNSLKLKGRNPILAIDTAMFSQGKKPQGCERDVEDQSTRFHDRVTRCAQLKTLDENVLRGKAQ